MARERRTRRQSKLQTRENLLRAAAEVFGRRGFYAASIDEIAAEAGFSKGAVYSNFNSKEELFMTLLDLHLESELQHIKSQFQSEGKEGNTSLAGTPQGFASKLEENRAWNMLSIEFALHAMRHPLTQQQLAERFRMLRNEITELLHDQYQATGQPLTIPAIPIDYFSWTILALGSGLALQAYLEPGALPTDLYTTIMHQLLTAHSGTKFD